jgi:hypothetical protein
MEVSLLWKGISSTVFFKHVFREHNKLANKISKDALDFPFGILKLEEVKESI